MINEVYIVTSGCCSDYHIVTVFTDKEKATAFVNAYNNHKLSNYADDYEIETYKTNDIDIREADGLMYYTVQISKNGGCYIGLAECGDDFVSSEDIGKVIEYKGGRQEGYRVAVLARNTEHAKRLAQDKFAQYRAKKEGLT